MSLIYNSQGEACKPHHCSACWVKDNKVRRKFAGFRGTETVYECPECGDEICIDRT